MANYARTDSLDRIILDYKRRIEALERRTVVVGGMVGGGPSGAAGGVLSGTYPNPGFAADMATQAELNAHESDTSSVHGITDTSQIALKNAANTFTLGQTISHADGLILSANGGKDTLSLSDTTANVGLTIGGDTNLYRQAANVLATDDSLFVTGYVYSTGSFTSVQTGGNVAYYANVLSESDPRFYIENYGILHWGSGSAAADVNLYRLGPGYLATDGALVTVGASSTDDSFNSYVTGQPYNRLQMTIAGKLEWGNGTDPVDTNLYREGLNTLRTNDKFWVDEDGSAGTYLHPDGYVGIYKAASNGWALDVALSSDSYGARFLVRSHGVLEWGSGADETDTNLYRSGVNTLRTDGTLYTETTYGVGVSNSVALGTIVEGDTYPRWWIRTQGVMEWGDGTGFDTNLYRNGASTLRTDDTFNPQVLYATAQVVANGSTANEISLFSDGKIYFGSASDTNLYRAAASTLQTDDQFVAAGLTAGASTFTGNIAMSSNRVTGLAAAVANGQAVRYEQLFTISANMVIDSNFEGSATTTNWTATNSTIESSTDVSARYGFKTGKLTASSSSQAYVGSAAYIQSIQVGQDYVFSAWARGDASTTNDWYIQINWFQSDNTYISNVQSSSQALTTSWARLLVTQAAPALAAKAVVYIIFATNTAGKIMYIDGVQLEEGTAPTGYAPKPDEILPGTVSDVELSANSVTAVKIAANAVVAGKIAAGAVTAGTIDADVVTATEIAAGAVSTSELAAGSVTTSKLSVAWSGANFLTNSSFENNTSSLSGWSITAVGTYSSGAFSTTSKWHGASSYKITITDAAGIISGGGSNYDHHAKAHLYQDTIIDTHITASAWVKAPAGRRLSLNVYRVLTGDLYPWSGGYDAVGSAGSTAGSYITATGEWQRVSASLTPYSGGAYATIGVHFRIGFYDGTNLANSDIVYIDAVQLEAGEVVTAWGPRPDEILANSITSTEIGPDSITTSELAADAVIAENILAGSVSADKLSVKIGGGNLLQESSAEGIPLDFWQQDAGTSGLGTLTQSQDTARFGTYSLKSEAANSGYIGMYTTDAGRVTVEPGQTYTATAYVKCSVATRSSTIYLDWYEDDALTTYETGDEFEHDGTWKRVQVTGTAPAGTQQVEIYVDLYHSSAGSISAGDIFYIDGIQLEEGDVATAYAPKTDEILPGTIVAEQIQAGQITAELLASDLLISSEIRTGNEGEQRVVISGKQDVTGGIKLISATNQELVSLPTSASGVAAFTGNLTAKSLTLENNFTLQGTNNKLDANALFEVTAQQAPPSTPPTVTLDTETSLFSGWGGYAPQPNGDSWTKNVGLFYDSSGNNGAYPTFLTVSWYNETILIYEYRVSTMALVRANVLNGFSPRDWRVCGITRRGNTIYLGIASQNYFIIYRYSATDLSPRSPGFAVYIDSDVTGTYKYDAVIGTDGTYVCVAMPHSTGSSTNIDIKRFSDDDTGAGAWAYHDTKALGTPNVNGQGQTIFVGLNYVSSKWYVSFNGNTDPGASGSSDYEIGVNQWDGGALTHDDETGFFHSAAGLTHDGTRWWSRVASGPYQFLEKHNSHTWTDTNAYSVFGYTWYDSSGSKETTISPQGNIKVRSDADVWGYHRAHRRRRFKLSIGTRPSGVPKYRIWFAHSSSTTIADSSLRVQTLTTHVSSETDTPLYVVDETTSGSAHSGSNSWPGGQTATIKSSTLPGAGGWELTGLAHKGIIPVGTIMAKATKRVPTLWLPCDATTVSRTTYSDLFEELCYNEGTFTITIASPGVASKTAHGFTTGDQVYLTTTGALPTGLTANTVLYYIIKNGADSFWLATSRANAVAGTKINTSGSQSGVHSVRSCPHGLGDGSTTFTLPDIQGRSPVGLGTGDDVNNIGDSEGEATVANRTPYHKHGIYFNTGPSGSNQTNLSTGGSVQVALADHLHLVSGNTDTKTAAYVVINYIIKY